MHDPNDSEDGTDWDDDEPERVAWDSEWTEQQEIWGGRPVYDRNGCPANQRRDGGLEYVASVYDEHYGDDDDD